MGRLGSWGPCWIGHPISYASLAEILEQSCLALQVRLVHDTAAHEQAARNLLAHQIAQHIAVGNLPMSVMRSMFEGDLANLPESAHHIRPFTDTIVEHAWQYLSAGKQIVRRDLLPGRHPGQAQLAAIKAGLQKVIPFMHSPDRQPGAQHPPMHVLAAKPDVEETSAAALQCDFAMDVTKAGLSRQRLGPCINV